MSDLQAHFHELADDELLGAVNVDFEQYTPEALSMARAEARQRGLDVRESAPPDAGASEPRLLRGVPVGTVLALEVVTLGFYFPYWLYRNWRILADRYGENIVPVSRALFAPFFVHDLFREIRRNSKKAGAARTWPPELLTLLFFASWVAAFIAGPGGREALAMAFAPLLLLTLVLALAQVEINATIRAHLGASPSTAQTITANSTAS